MLVFFTTSSRNRVEKEYLRKLVERIENNSFEVFWPERDLRLMSSDKMGWRKALAACQEKIDQSEAVVSVIDGHERHPFETMSIGMALAHIQSDRRKLFVGMVLEGQNESLVAVRDDAFISVFDSLPKSEYDLIDCLKSYLITKNKE